MKLSKYIVTTSIDGCEGGPNAKSKIIFSCLTNVTIVVSESIFHNIVYGRFDQLHADVIMELKEAGILVPSERDELATVLEENDSYHDNFSLFLNISASCQSGCASCVPKQRDEHMTDIIRRAIAKYTEKELSSRKYTAFNIIWNVDDPGKDLLAIVRLSESNLIFSEQYSVLYTASMICDGASLNKKIFGVLFHQCGIKSYHVTLTGDGCGPTSKTSRVIDNLKDILNNFPFVPQDGIIFEIRININTFNQEAVGDIIERFATAGAQNRVTFQFGFREDDQTDIIQLAEHEIEYLLHAIQKGFILGILPARTFVPCAAVDKGAASVNLRGEMFSCNALSFATESIIAANTIGSLTEYQPSFSQDTQFRKWFQEIRNGETPCYSCNLLPVCGGGCRLKWEKSQNGCPTFKYNMEDRLILSYLNQKTRMNELILY